jgi:predicted N-formylglutamate amidohydrolase
MSWPDPVEVLRGAAHGPVVLSCEHAGAAVPAFLAPSVSDMHFLGTHWGVDLGAAALTRSLSRRLSAPAVMGRLSRLVADLNRPPDHPDLAREFVEGGVPIDFNRGLDGAARAERIAKVHVPFHAALDDVLRAREASPAILLSIHTFTPLYCGVPREVAIGVLFDQWEDLAKRLRRRLDLGPPHLVAENEPWSGKDGLIWSPALHGTRHGLRYLELEVRQDLLETPAAVESMAARIEAAVRLEWEHPDDL